MVTVAMSFDAPIKLQFPRHSTEPDTSIQFSILGECAVPCRAKIRTSRQALTVESIPLCDLFRCLVHF